VKEKKNNLKVEKLGINETVISTTFTVCMTTVKTITTCVFPSRLLFHGFPFRQTAALWNTECRRLHWLHCKGEFWFILQQAALFQRLDGNLE
jgi:hypothetical protein